MKYFSMFSGIGGFERGIEDAFMLIKDKNIHGSATTTGDQAGQCEQQHNVSNEGLSTTGDQDAFRDTGSRKHIQERRSGWTDREYEWYLSVLLGRETWRDSEHPVCIGFSEIDKNAINIYKHHFPGHHNYGSATEINAAELPDFDLLVGGFPCQAFSIAGKRLGFDDTRGTLFFEIARILREKRPGQFLLENVKGLLSHDNGNTFKTIISTLVELGYCVEWQVLNSKHYGVPQNRERVFIHGFREGCGRQVFPIGCAGGKDCQIVGRATGIKGHDYLRRIYSPDGSSPTLPTGTGGNHEGKFEIGTRIRRLTPVECERLQGFPDDWTKYGADGKTMSDSARYKACGNAVTTNVIKAVMEAMYE
jgi:site-specific DNA-cytosine methylase